MHFCLHSPVQSRYHAMTYHVPRFSSLNTGIFVHFLSGPVEPFVEILAVDPPCDGDKALALQFLVELPNELIGVGLRHPQLVRNFFRPDESVLRSGSSFPLI